MASSLTTICRLLPIYGYEVTKSRVERWISDGNFRPLDAPDPGMARLWSFPDLVRLIAFIRLVDAGCKLEVGRAIGALHGFKAGAAYLVVAALRQPLRRPAGTNEDITPAWRRAIDRMGDSEQYVARVCARSRALDALGRTGVLAWHVVELDTVEEEARQIMARAQKLHADEESG
jgi:hypothetical protein